MTISKRFSWNFFNTLHLITGSPHYLLLGSPGDCPGPVQAPEECEGGGAGSDCLGPGDTSNLILLSNYDNLVSQLVLTTASAASQAADTSVLTGLNLTSLNLTGLNLTGLNLTGLNLTGLNLTSLWCQPSRHQSQVRTFFNDLILISTIPELSCPTAQVSPGTCEGTVSTCWSPGHRDTGGTPHHSPLLTPSFRLSRQWSLLF